jgi:hypothetical protein
MLLVWTLTFDLILLPYGVIVGVHALGWLTQFAKSEIEVTSLSEIPMERNHRLLIENTVLDVSDSGSNAFFAEFASTSVAYSMVSRTALSLVITVGTSGAYVSVVVSVPSAMPAVRPSVKPLA